MKVTVIHVGDFKEKFFVEAFAEYKKRLGAYCDIEDILVKESPCGETMSEAEITKTLETEGEKILSHMDKRSLNVALCVEGRMYTSEELSSMIVEAKNNGKSRIVFVIGSSFGLAPKVKEFCDVKLSFSRMTFPHQLMRVILAEQVYRAFNIAAGGKYHK